jgi:hypothetical protein
MLNINELQLRHRRSDRVCNGDVGACSRTYSACNPSDAACNRCGGLCNAADAARNRCGGLCNPPDAACNAAVSGRNRADTACKGAGVLCNACVFEICGGGRVTAVRNEANTPGHGWQRRSISVRVPTGTIKSPPAMSARHSTVSVRPWPS